jgi:rod shape-determining protein MreC
MSWLWKHRVGVFGLGVLIFCLALFRAHVRAPFEQNWFDKTLVWLTAPIQKGIVWTIDGAASFWRDYIYLVDIRAENLHLRNDIDELQRRLTEFSEIQSENLRLRTLIEMRDAIPTYRVLGARVIGVGMAPAARVIRIDRGLADGLRVGDAVIAGSGLVGRVSLVLSGYAEVTLIVDGRSAVDIVTQTHRSRGILSGTGGDDACVIDYLFRSVEVSVGEKVVTSGLGGSFPPGLLVGTISRVAAPEVGMYQKVELRPAVSFASIEEVLVVLSTTAVRSILEKPQP